MSPSTSADATVAPPPTGVVGLKEFLLTVVTGPEDNGSGMPAWFCMALGPDNGHGWIEEWYSWPNDIDKIVERTRTKAREHNIYFSSYLFKAPSSLKTNVLPTRTIQADLDNADIKHLPLAPTILVETSPRRHQAFWVLRETLDLDVHEVLSRKLTYAIKDCDRSGWPLGRKVRLPETFNYKYLDGAKPVRIVDASMQTHDPAQLELLPDVPRAGANDTLDEDFIAAPTGAGIGPQELLSQVGDRLPPPVIVQYDTVSRGPEGRSGALWALMCGAFRAGLTRPEVFTLAKGSANNKFADLRYNGDRELAKDVLRAESLVQAGLRDERGIILNARRVKGMLSEKHQHVFNLVLGFMKESGDFIRAGDDSVWYVRRDIGRPVAITTHSDWLNAMLEMQFGLNRTESAQSYTVAALQSYTRMLPNEGIRGSLTHYDPDQRIMLLHTGRKDIVRIGASHMSTMTDGAGGVVFPWRQEVRPFSVNTSPLGGGAGGSAASRIDWAEYLFGPHLENIVNLKHDESLAILRVWFMFMLFRSEAFSRPILALFGQPGSGKSTILKKLYVLLYGMQKSVGSITSPDDFDHASANNPLYAIDNADTWERWLPDRLALSAGTSDIEKRKLYTDADLVTIKRSAMIAISAHNPKFGREDVADRLLILTFSRLGHFAAETDILNDVNRKRNLLWGSIVHDIQRVLSTPLPPAGQAPQFRVEDFARLGHWIAIAVGCEADFASAIEHIRSSQRSFTLDEDQILVVAMRKLCDSKSVKDSPDTWRTASELWTLLSMCSSDTASFERFYRNAVSLAKKLFSLQEALREIFVIEWKNDPILATRVWRIIPR